MPHAALATKGPGYNRRHIEAACRVISAKPRGSQVCEQSAIVEPKGCNLAGMVQAIQVKFLQHVIYACNPDESVVHRATARNKLIKKCFGTEP